MRCGVTVDTITMDSGYGKGGQREVKEKIGCSRLNELCIEDSVPCCIFHIGLHPKQCKFYKMVHKSVYKFYLYKDTYVW